MSDLPPCSPEELAWIAAGEPEFDLQAKPFHVKRPNRPPAPVPPPKRGLFDRLFGRTPSQQSLAPPEPEPEPEPPAPSARRYLAQYPTYHQLLAYHRAPPEGIDRYYGKAARSPDGSQILLCRGPFWIIPSADIHAVRLGIYRVRGAMISDLSLLCLTAKNSEPERLPVAEKGGTDWLDGLAAGLADWLAVPLVREEDDRD